MGKRKDFLPSLHNGLRTELRMDRVETVRQKVALGYFSDTKNMEGTAEALFDVFFDRVFSADIA